MSYIFGCHNTGILVLFHGISCGHAGVIFTTAVILQLNITVNININWSTLIIFSVSYKNRTVDRWSTPACEVIGILKNNQAIKFKVTGYIECAAVFALILQRA